MSSSEGPTLYRYVDAVNGFFEFGTDNARAILPAGLQPVEPHHGLSVLAVTAFEFHESPVGSYREIVLSVLIAPRIAKGEPMPRAAMYPFMVGTSTEPSRKHGTERWLLPHIPKDLDIQMDRSDTAMAVTVRDAGAPVLDLKVTQCKGVDWQAVEHRYQTFSRDASGPYLSALLMTGPFIEHEEETGALTLHAHPFNVAVDRDGVTTSPFREQWMKQGVETIFPLQPLTALAGR